MVTQDDSARGQPDLPYPTDAAAARVEQGVCYVLFAYDIGFAIDLDEAERRIVATKQRGTMPRKRRAPHYFEYHPAPLRVTEAADGVAIGPFQTAPSVDAVIFDFGAISIMYSIPLSCPLSDLLTLSDELWDHGQLLEASRSVATRLQAAMGSAITRPSFSELVEDYTIYQIECVTPGIAIDEFITCHALPLAQILRAEREVLSRQEVDDALACRLSFGREDGLLIDWNAALVFDRDAEDVRAVLEYANVELLELRYLDDQLDRDLGEAYETVTRRKGRGRVAFGSRKADLRRVAALQMDSALLFEGVNNSLKLLGDQYLARVYRLASQRLHLTEWDANITRKLQVLKELYERLSDQQATWRLEVLEWIIIVLIAVSIILPHLPIPGF